MEIDTNIQLFLNQFNALIAQNPNFKPTVAQGRENYLKFALLHAGWPLSLARVEDVHIATADKEQQMLLRIYTPELEKKLPALIYFHGGGWQRGDLATHDSICRHFAVHANVIVVAVEWRLAPEFKFPHGPNDCLAAYEWVVRHGEQYNIDINRLGIGGDSAGGNMTAVTAQRLRDANRENDIVQPIFQLLLYPSLDLSCTTWSYKTYSDHYFLTTDHVKEYIDTYINRPEDIESPLASPLKQKNLYHLPRTHIITAGYDPLRAEGEIYAEKLRQAGVNTTYKCYESMIHAFLHMNHSVPIVGDILKEIAHEIHTVLYNK